MAIRFFVVFIALLMALPPSWAGSTKKYAKSGSRDTAAAKYVQIPPLPEQKPKSWHKRKKTKTRISARHQKPSPKQAAQSAPEPEKKPDVNPNEWLAVEVLAARSACDQILKKLDAVTVPVTPMKKGPCGDAAPVHLVSVGKNPQVTFSPPAKVNCNMVKALHKWTTKSLQPLARRYLKSPLIKIEVMSDYSCRNAYGRKKGRLSEHALANALDIGGFVTAKGKRTKLLAHWGPTKRDIAQKLAEEEKAREEARKRAIAAQEEKDKRQNEALAEAVAKDEAAQTKKAVSTASDEKKPTLAVAPAKLGGPKGKKVAARAGKKRKRKKRNAKEPRFSPAPDNYGRFLRQAHISACRIFGTVLGPEANDAHRNHFHVDLAPRRRSNYCE